MPDPAQAGDTENRTKTIADEDRESYETIPTLII